MDDRLRETLSAMMDDEADELSVRRLLSHQDQTLVRDQWQRWQQVRDLMHGSHSPTEGVDVTAGVREALDGRSAATNVGKLAGIRAPGRWRWPALATVVLAAVIGFGAGWDARDGRSGSAVSEVAAQSPTAGAVEPPPLEEVMFHRLDEEQREQVSRYLLEHAQHNSVGAGRGAVGYARVVSAGNGY